MTRALRAFAFIAASCATARADDRIASDVTLAPEAVVTRAHDRARVGVGARGHCLATAGAYARLFPGDPVLGSVGVDARPLFLPRWLKNKESDRSFWELTIDSLHLSLGGRFVAHARPSFEIGGGLEAPLFARYRGPYLGGEVLYVAKHGALVGGRGSEWTGVLTIGYRFGVVTHAVDAGDRR